MEIQKLCCKMLDSEFVDQFLTEDSSLAEREKQFKETKKLFETLNDYENDDLLNSWNTCKFFTRLLTKIQKMENRIQDLEEQLESTSYNLGELEAQVHKTGVYMEDW
jgi:DNA repair ATPase RecN